MICKIRGEQVSVFFYRRWRQQLTRSTISIGIVVRIDVLPIEQSVSSFQLQLAISIVCPLTVGPAIIVLGFSLNEPSDNNNIL